MKLSESVVPISHFKAHASELVKDIAENGTTLVVTQNGKATVVVQDVVEYERIQQTLALLKMLSQSRQSLRAGKTRPVREVFNSIRKKAANNVE